MPQSSVTVAQISARKIAEHLRMPPPTDEQVAVIEAAPDEPLLVVAGAGSGKTETMAARVVWLVANKHVEPEQILGLTFTRKAAGELATRVRARLRQLREAGLFADELLPHERALATRSEEHTSELQSRGHLVCRLLLEKKNNQFLIIKNS